LSNATDSATRLMARQSTEITPHIRHICSVTRTTVNKINTMQMLQLITNLLMQHGNTHGFTNE